MDCVCDALDTRPPCRESGTGVPSPWWLEKATLRVRRRTDGGTLTVEVSGALTLWDLDAFAQALLLAPDAPVALTVDMRRVETADSSALCLLAVAGRCLRGDPLFDGSPNNDFSAYFGNTAISANKVFSETDSGSSTFALESYTVLATGSSTPITFKGADAYESVYLDDVSVTPNSVGGAAPEPSEWAALGFTLIGVGGLLLRARRRLA